MVHGDPTPYPQLIQNCYPADTLSQLDSLRRSLAEHDDGSAYHELTWLALLSILRECSPVGTAQWQYVLPGKRKVNPQDPYRAFKLKIGLMSNDMAIRQEFNHGPEGHIAWQDARVCSSIPDQWADLVITSPPYANNYDYADATRLEMTFFGEVTSWGDLQDAVRRYLMRSCSQHVGSAEESVAPLLEDPAVESIIDELAPTVDQLKAVRMEHGGRKAYYTMITAYFHDMARVWQSLRRTTHDRSVICFVIGDSAPYGVHVPVERWLGRLAIAAGFTSFEFQKLRDRNTKWKNRKHRVPLKEGLLWVAG